MGLQVQLADQPIDSRLAMLKLNLTQYQPRRIAVIPAAEFDLRTDRFTCAFNGYSFYV